MPVEVHQTDPATPYRVHVQAVPAGSPEVAALGGFRDALRADRLICRRYAALKRAIVETARPFPTPDVRPKGATHMIQLNGLTKRYGPTLADDDLSFRVQPGKVIGFLGPNGAGKSTSMRMVLALNRPTAGQALVDGRRYQEPCAPLRVVGGLLDAGAVHPRRSAHDRLLALARSDGIARSRIGDCPASP